MHTQEMTEWNLKETSLWEYAVDRVYVLFQKCHSFRKQSEKEIASQWIVESIWCLDPSEEEDVGPLCVSELPQASTNAKESTTSLLKIRLPPQGVSLFFIMFFFTWRLSFND